MLQAYSLSTRLPGALDRKQVWQGKDLKDAPLAQHTDFSICVSDPRGSYVVEIISTDRGVHASTASRNEAGYDTLRKNIQGDGATVALAICDLSRKVCSLIGFHAATQDFVKALAIAATLASESEIG